MLEAVLEKKDTDVPSGSALDAMHPELNGQADLAEEPSEKPPRELRVLMRNAQAPATATQEQGPQDELLVSPEALRTQGKRLFRELGKITDPNQSIHRRVTKMWTSLTSRRTPDDDQELLWTQTKDVSYPRFEVNIPDEGDGDPVTSEVPSRAKGDMVIEGFGDKAKNHVESYVVQLNRFKGNRARPYKMKIAPSGITLLKKNEATGTFDPEPDIPPLLLRELQETIDQLRTGKIAEIKHRPDHQLFKTSSEHASGIQS